MFKRSCEDTLAILKKSSEIFILILNVFKYDPLYNWYVNLCISNHLLIYANNDMLTSMNIQETESP